MQRDAKFKGSTGISSFSQVNLRLNLISISINLDFVEDDYFAYISCPNIILLFTDCYGLPNSYQDMYQIENIEYGN